MSHFSLRTADLGDRHRVAEFEAICTRVCHLKIEPADAGFASHTTISRLGEIILADTTHSPCTTRRSLALAAETGDNLLIHLPLAGGFSIRQGSGAEQDCRPGQLYLDPTEQPGVARFHAPETNVLYLSMPRAALAEAGARPALRSQTGMTPHWRLVAGYARALNAEAGQMPAADLARCAEHLLDLVTLALGAGREATEIARGRGARAARLRAIKADIEVHLTAPELSPGWIAARHGISPRYLRALFAAEETSFSDHVAARRLRLVAGRLRDPAEAGVPVSRIAYEAGFADLSWFNARFRARFGLTPSGMRAEALHRAREAP